MNLKLLEEAKYVLFVLSFPRDVSIHSLSSLPPDGFRSKGARACRDGAEMPRDEGKFFQRRWRVDSVLQLSPGKLRRRLNLLGPSYLMAVSTHPDDDILVRTCVTSSAYLTENAERFMNVNCDGISSPTYTTQHTEKSEAHAPASKILVALLLRISLLQCTSEASSNSRRRNLLKKIVSETLQ